MAGRHCRWRHEFRHAVRAASCGVCRQSIQWRRLPGRERSIVSIVQTDRSSDFPLRCIPRALGVLLMLGGASYVINSFTNFLAPAIGAHLAPFVIPVAILGEGALTLWLLVKGVKVPASGS